MINLTDPFPYYLGIPCNVQPAFTPTILQSLALTSLALVVGYWIGSDDRG